MITAAVAIPKMKSILSVSFQLTACHFAVESDIKNNRFVFYNPVQFLIQSEAVFYKPSIISVKKKELR